MAMVGIEDAEAMRRMAAGETPFRRHAILEHVLTRLSAGELLRLPAETRRVVDDYSAARRRFDELMSDAKPQAAPDALPPFEPREDFERLLRLKSEDEDAFMLRTSPGTRNTLTHYERWKQSAGDAGKVR